MHSCFFLRENYSFPTWQNILALDRIILSLLFHFVSMGIRNSLPHFSEPIGSWFLSTDWGLTSFYTNQFFLSHSFQLQIAGVRDAS